MTDPLTPVPNRLIWIDLEMTGLEPESGDRILEIATVITNPQLEIIATGPVIAINQSHSILSKMDDWCQTHHKASGLLNRVKISQETEKTAEQKTLDFLSKYVPANHSPICGNSVWQDRRFLIRYMPALERYFHYRQLDVSSLKILTQLWQPGILKKLTKQSKHQALEDIQDSIEELKLYYQAFFKPTQ